MIPVRCLGLFFDCDGVLVDSTDSGERSWTRWAREFDLRPADVLAGVHGRRSAETVALFVPERERARAAARIDEIEIADAAGTRPIRGADQLLRALPRNVWAVVTSATPAVARTRLAAAALPDPPVLITADDVTAGKPAPDGYRAAAEALGLRCADTVVVEDTPRGVEAARAAGAGRVIGIGPRALESDADLVIRDLRGLSWHAPAPDGRRDDAMLQVPEAAVLRGAGYRRD